MPVPGQCVNSRSVRRNAWDDATRRRGFAGWPPSSTRAANERLKLPHDGRNRPALRIQLLVAAALSSAVAAVVCVTCSMLATACDT
jgi:hypothetical protein